LGNGIFNLGGDYTISVYDMACLISKRAALIFGKEIPVIRPEGINEEWELDYSSRKLEATGFTTVGCIEKEIDDLLIFCQRNFSKEKA
jgi:UDP-glucose 4-epimerase